ncbi:MAG: hypothetical protein SOZ62_01695 [Eubacteriales bacterium]|nr:hypothetical protein [Eubacteriales bacterium]
MKKRFLCALLAALMIFAVIPAMALTAYADGGESGTGTESREDVYERYKDLWYDNGHLMSFVDMCKITEEEAVNVNSDTIADELDKAVLLYGGIFAEDWQAKHNYIKIIGGKNAGGYYMLFTDKTQTITRTDDGFVSFNQKTQKTDFYFKAGINYSTVFRKEHVTERFQSPKDTAMLGDKQNTIVRDTYYAPSAEKLYDGTYGSMTVEEVIKINPTGFVFNNDSNMQIIQYPGIGTLGIKGGSDGVALIGTAHSHSHGARKEVPDGKTWGPGSTIHFAYGATYSTPEVYTNTIRAVCNVDKAHLGNLLDAKLGEPIKYVTPDASRMNAKIMQPAFHTYYIRIYDCTLTDLQIKQNHFADLCYYYQLKNTDKLAAFGSVALNEEFYQSMFGYDVGTSTADQIIEMQTLIDERIAQFESISDDDKLTYDEALTEAYNNIVSSDTASQSAISKINDVISAIGDNVSDIEGVIALKDEASKEAEILKGQLEELRELLRVANENKDNITAYADAVRAAKTASETAYSLAMSTSDMATYFTNKNIVDVNLPKAVENSGKAVYAAQVAASIQAKAAMAVLYANSADAMAAFNIENYITFAGFQQRVYGYAGMRAVFNVNTDAVNKGYSYNNGQKNYRIVAIGFLYVADSEADSFDDITVVGDDGAYSVYAKGKKANTAKIVSLDNRYLVDEETRAKATDNDALSVYGFENSMFHIGTNDFKKAFEQKYYWRAFAVLEGEGTSFTAYLNIKSANLGTDSVSLSQITEYLIENYSGQKFLDEHLWVYKVHYYCGL